MRALSPKARRALVGVQRRDIQIVKRVVVVVVVFVVVVAVAVL